MAKRRRIVGPLTLIDLIIIVVVILIGILATSILLNSQQTRVTLMQKGEMTWTIIVPEARLQLLDAVEIGDEVRLDVAAEPIGEVIDVKANPVLIEVPNAEGELMMQESQVMKDLYITVQGPAEYNGMNFHIGGIPYKLNDAVDLYSDRWHFKGAFIDMQWNGESPEGGSQDE